MATRVISGHGGIPLVADELVWRLFWALQLATLLRLAAAVWPAYGAILSAAAAVTWSVVWVTWAARYAPVLLQPRRDVHAPLAPGRASGPAVYPNRAKAHAVTPGRARLVNRGPGSTSYASTYKT